jgi:hypothetical protein
MRLAYEIARQINPKSIDPNRSFSEEEKGVLFGQTSAVLK